jgi:hypothetical protein
MEWDGRRSSHTIVTQNLELLRMQRTLFFGCTSSSVPVISSLLACDLPVRVQVLVGRHLLLPPANKIPEVCTFQPIETIV